MGSAVGFIAAECGPTMSDDPFLRAVDAMTVVALAEDAKVILEYGPPKPAVLVVGVITQAGERCPLIFKETAIRQLASLLRKIEDQFPGAVRGH